MHVITEYRCGKCFDVFDRYKDADDCCYKTPSREERRLDVIEILHRGEKEVVGKLKTNDFALVREFEGESKIVARWATEGAAREFIKLSSRLVSATVP